MKFNIASDLFLNAYKHLIPSATTLVLAGSICKMGDIDFLARFFKEVSNRWENILYVPGNYEFYDHYFNDYKLLEEKLSPYKNIIVANNKRVYIDGVTFICSTLWNESFEDDNILVGYGDDTYALTKEYANDLYQKNVAFIENEIKKKEDVVIVTYFPPSKEIQNILYDKYHIKKWICGRQNMTNSNTNIVSHPYISYDMRTSGNRKYQPSLVVI